MIQGDISGHNGFIPVEKMLDSIFVHNEFFLAGFMHVFFDRLSLNLTLSIILSDVGIILLSVYLIVIIRRLSIYLEEAWWRKQLKF